MINAHKLETVLTEDGTLTLQGLPWKAGESVEVIILNVSMDKVVKPTFEENTHPLKGKVIQYDDPFGSAVPLEDWDVLK